MDIICSKYPEHEWMSLSTLDRRIQEPISFKTSELRLLQEAVKSIVSNASWIHIKRNITEGMRENYGHLIDEAISNGFALHGTISDTVDPTEDDEEFIKQINAFYIQAPEECRRYWDKVLPCYLKLPDLAKASILCSSYIGHSDLKNKESNKKIKEFLDYFPIYWGIGMIAGIDDSYIQQLGDILKVSTQMVEDIPEQYRGYAISKDNIPNFDGRDTTIYNPFVEYAIKYKHTVTDYQVDAKDFIHGVSFILYIDRIEWLLAYATSIFSYKVNQIDQNYSIRREYHDRGCTGFRFSDPELDYLCELLYVVKSDT